ncbi:MAG: LysM peptidoglycan-binding domain-containing protein [Alkalibacterium sp.]|nr:LysM peptidoglycan-binding domain-containing protein [Alkalibacterium sp.]
MSKKDRESMEELWSKRFDEEVDYTDEEPMSRKAKREREQRISPILTVIVIFLALLIILPISAYAWFSNREDLSEDPTSPSIEQPLVVNDEEEELEEEPEPEEEEELEEESEEESEEVEEPVEEEVEEEETVVQPSEPEPEPEQSTPPAEESVAASTEQSASEETQTPAQSAPEEEVSQPEETEPQPETGSYTVKAGDNMYRIALNHGMTTEELMQLNNLSEESVFIGQELRVR